MWGAPSQRRCRTGVRGVWVLVAAVAACGEEGAEVAPPMADDQGTRMPSTPGPLTDVERWRRVEAGEDPFADRPQTFRCNAGGHQVEGETYEVETDKCAYLTAVQPSLRAIAAGDRVESVMWHQFLVADEPAEAHLAVRLGAYVIAEARPTLPFPPEFYTTVWTAPADIEAGTPIYIHVHNHGANSYNFGGVRLLEP